MPFGREKNFIRAARFTTAATGFRCQAPACTARMAVVGGWLAALFRVGSISAGVRTIVKRGLSTVTPRGFELQQSGTAINWIVYGSAGSPVTATWNRVLTAADVDKWMLALGRFTPNTTPSGLQLTINGVSGTGVATNALTYVAPLVAPGADDLYLGCADVAFTQFATDVSLAQVAIAANGAVNSITSPLAHFQASQRALRLEELPHTVLYIDFEKYGGGGIDLTAIPATQTMTNFCDDVRSARVENFGTAGPVPVTMRSAASPTADWVTP